MIREGKNSRDLMNYLPYLITIKHLIEINNKDTKEIDECIYEIENLILSNDEGIEEYEEGIESFQ